MLVCSNMLTSPLVALSYKKLQELEVTPLGWSSSASFRLNKDCVYLELKIKFCIYKSLHFVFFGIKQSEAK